MDVSAKEGPQVWRHNLCGGLDQHIEIQGKPQLFDGSYWLHPQGSSLDRAREAHGGPRTLGMGAPRFLGHLEVHMEEEHMHTYRYLTKEMQVQDQPPHPWKGLLGKLPDIFCPEGSNLGGYGSAVTALSSATCIRKNQLSVINRGLKKGGQPLWLVGRIGSGHSGANRALITIPFQPITFLEGTIQHQVQTQFQIPTARQVASSNGLFLL